MSQSRPSSAGASSPRTKGGSRPNSGRKESAAYSPLLQCGLLTADGATCTIVVKNAFKFGCHHHEAAFAKAHPELYEILLAIKQHHMDIYRGVATADEGTDHMLQTIHYAVNKVQSLTRAGMPDDTIATWYMCIYSMAVELGVGLGADQIAYLESWRGKQPGSPKKMPVKAQLLLEKAQAAQEAELLRKAEAEQKKALQMKLSNDVDELCGTVDDMAISPTEPSSQPAAGIKAFRRRTTENTDSSEEGRVV